MSLKVLVVDDEPGIVEVVCMDLEQNGFSTESASSGNEAIRKVDATAFDFVVSDIRMPNGTGLELLAHVCSLAAPRPSVILITGFSDVREKDVLARGASALLHKPDDVMRVAEVLRTL